MSTPPAPDTTTTTPPRVRATNADRDRVASMIETSVADGSLTPEEGEQRIQAARAAVHRDDFAALVADLSIAQVPASTQGTGVLSSVRSFAARRRVLSLAIVLVFVLAVVGVGFAVGFDGGHGEHGGHGGTHEQFHRNAEH